MLYTLKIERFILNKKMAKKNLQQYNNPFLTSLRSYFRLLKQNKTNIQNGY